MAHPDAEGIGRGWAFRLCDLGVGRGSLAVMFNMGLGCLCRVVHGVFVVPACQMRVVSCRFVFARFIVLCGFSVMPCRVFVML